MKGVFKKYPPPIFPTEPCGPPPIPAFSATDISLIDVRKPSTKKATLNPVLWKRRATLSTDSISIPAKNQTTADENKKIEIWTTVIINIIITDLPHYLNTLRQNRTVISRNYVHKNKTDYQFDSPAFFRHLNIFRLWSFARKYNSPNEILAPTRPS